MTDILIDLGPIGARDHDPSSSRIFTECALLALRCRDAKTTADGRAAAQEIADAIAILAVRWGVRI